MAWNDYIFDYDNGHKFESSRYQVIFSITDKRPKISELEYAQEVTNQSDYTFNVDSIGTLPSEDYYMIAWFEVTNTNNINATGRSLNSIASDYSPQLQLPSLTWSDSTTIHAFPFNTASGTNRTPFVLPNQQIERKVTCNFPILGVLATNNIVEGYTLAIGKRAIYDYVVTGDWDTYIQPWIDAGAFVNMNYNPEPVEEPDGSEYTIYNTGQRGTWSLGDIVSDVSTPYYRWARVKLASSGTTDGRIAFYKAGLEDGIIKLKPVITASVVFCEYSTDGGATWTESSVFPFDYIYGERTNELGTFIYATRTGLNGDSGAPIFEDLTTATAWVNHDPSVDISDALNYDDMASRYGISNKTGIAETTTTMGTASNFKSHFTQKYILDSGEVTKISNAFFDTTTNIFEDIKKGLEMMGESIVDAICGIKFWPVDLTTVFTRLQSQSYIFFGGYQWPPTGDPTSINVYKLTGYDGYLSLGTFTIEKSFPGNDYRNYEPYCNVSIYLPYIGMQKLSYNKYVGKTTEVRYYLDINTGGCMACLLCDGKLYDYFNGQMGVDIPITITDYAGFATAELQNISNLAGVGANAGAALMAGGSGNIGGAALNTAGAIGAFEKSMYDLQTTSINNFNQTKGGSGAIGNEYLPQYVYLIFEYIKTDETPNLINLAGRASNASGNLGSFSGYLEVDEVELKTSAGMTEAEKNNFISLLHSGIII